MDPRVKTPALGLSQQFTLSKQLYDGITEAEKALSEIRAARSGLPAGSPRTAALEKLEGQSGGFGGGRGAAATGPDTFNSLIGSMNQLMNLLQGADVTPTTQLVAAVSERRADLAKLTRDWQALKADARP